MSQTAMCISPLSLKRKPNSKELTQQPYNYNGQFVRYAVLQNVINFLFQPHLRIIRGTKIIFFLYFEVVQSMHFLYQRTPII